MSRYTVTAHHGQRGTDAAATIGYDRMLRTYFAQAFPEGENEECAFWIGCFLEEFPTLDSLHAGAEAEGYRIEGITSDMIAAMEAEARNPAGPSIAERMGLAR
ncbi:hypothetical protein LJJ21_004741 [Salmonella enterica]|nr:hypothetical protein [Salmonella enterica]